jgi:hypothetical protein
VCGGARPAVLAPGSKRRKTVIKWTVTVRWIPEGGGVCDGDGVVEVDILTKEARWKGPP